MFIERLERDMNSLLQTTENGAKGYATYSNPFVDFNFRITSYMNGSADPVADFYEMFREDKILAIQMIFFLRDIRGGIGQRKTFREIFRSLAKTEPEVAMSVLRFIPEYGRWDDLFVLEGTSLENNMVSMIKNQLNSDIKGMNNGDSISLLAKWMPSINTSSKETVALATKLSKLMGMSHASYRKTISKLRKYLNVVERDISAKEYENIDYSQIPSKAHLKYKNVFELKDSERYLKYLESLKSGDTKINAGALAPYDIWNKYTPEDYWWDAEDIEYSETYEQMWKSLPDTGNLESTLVVADGSGSMCTSVMGSTTALDVAQSLAVYFGERCQGEFKNKFVTFSSKPQLVKFGEGSLLSKIHIVSKYTEVANTNIKRVFDIVLKTAIDNNMEQSELPETILIISDMEFDFAVDEQVNKALMEIISDKYKEKGYILPKLVFWNVNSRSTTVPLQGNDAGVLLVSGFNTAAIQMVMTGQLDPYLAIKDVLKGDRYRPIEESLKLVV